MAIVFGKLILSSSHVFVHCVPQQQMSIQRFFHQTLRQCVFLGKYLTANVLIPVPIFSGSLLIGTVAPIVVFQPISFFTSLNGNSSQVGLSIVGDIFVNAVFYIPFLVAGTGAGAGLGVFWAGKARRAFMKKYM